MVIQIYLPDSRWFINLYCVTDRVTVIAIDDI